MTTMTHDEIGEFAAERMRKKGYPMVWANMRSIAAGEQPDVMAFKSMYDCVVIEVKVSRSDFLADKKKPWRNGTINGMGTERVYLTPPNLLKPSEIPYGWQLWEVHEQKSRTIIKVIKGMKKGKVLSWNKERMEDGWVYPNCEPGEIYHFRQTHNKESVSNWLVVIMRRIAQTGVDVSLFGNCEHMKNLGFYSDET